MNLLSKINLTILVFCISAPLIARETILITYELNKDRAALVEKILIRDVYLPKQLIETRYQKSPCKARDASIVQICIKENKEIEFAHFNQEVVQRSLSVFWRGKI